ncbi:MAG: sugar MFS transporter [Bacteroidetes bacterium]|nr:sugar MFS transporter [Bacteroidota bacterium]
MNSASANNHRYSLALLSTLFFMWGFITVLNDILIPHLKGLFALNYTQTMLIQFCFFGAYFITSIPAGTIISKIGYKRGIVLGLSVTGLGALLFFPASIFISYTFFLTALFVLASGITILQVAANPFVAVLGPPETASSRLNLTQAINSLGTTIAPYFGSLLILETQGMHRSPAEEAASVQGPYVLIALLLGIIAVLIAFSRLPAISDATMEEYHDTKHFGKKSAWQYKHLIRGALAIFLYVGGEVTIGSFMVNYLMDLKIDGMVESDAGKYVSFYWGGAMVGRFIGAALLQRIRPHFMLSFCAIAAISLILISTNTSGHLAMYSMIAVGLFNSIMFANIFTMSMEGLGKFTGEGSGILCMAIVGGAIVPLLTGFLADEIGLQAALMITVLCYGYILYFGTLGYKRDRIE